MTGLYLIRETLWLYGSGKHYGCTDLVVSSRRPRSHYRSGHRRLRAPKPAGLPSSVRDFSDRDGWRGVAGGRSPALAAPGGVSGSLVRCALGRHVGWYVLSSDVGGSRLDYGDAA